MNECEAIQPEGRYIHEEPSRDVSLTYTLIASILTPHYLFAYWKESTGSMEMSQNIRRFHPR